MLLFLFKSFVGFWWLGAGMRPIIHACVSTFVILASGHACAIKSNFMAYLRCVMCLYYLFISVFGFRFGQTWPSFPYYSNTYAVHSKSNGWCFLKFDSDLFICYNLTWATHKRNRLFKLYIFLKFCRRVKRQHIFQPTRAQWVETQKNLLKIFDTKS